MPVMKCKLCSCLAGMQSPANVEVTHPVAPVSRRCNMMARMSAVPSVPRTRAAGARAPERSLATGTLAKDRPDAASMHKDVVIQETISLAHHT